MSGRGTLRGLWAFLVVAVLPILVSSIATAAPGYPVQDQPEATYTVAYEPSSHVLTVTDTAPDSATTDTPDVSEDVVVASGEVAGPNGQVNHGQVIKQLHDLIDGDNVGCITSAVAQSDLGKGDQQVRPNDTTPVETGGLDPTVLDIECTDHGQDREPSPANPSADSPSNRPDAPGRSGDAPGNNK